jgi:hypothetical protein
MSNVISIAAVRAERLRQALAIHGRNGETIVIETRTGQVIAEKVNCRDRFAEIVDGFGEYFVIDYNDIRTLHPAAVTQTSVVNARGEFLPAPNFVAAPCPVAILPFARPQRRR